MNEQTKTQNWIPIESDPDLWNKFMQTMGLNIHQYHFQEMLGLEEWAQAMIQGTTLGLVLLYDQTEKQANTINEYKGSEGFFYMKQYAHNACGTIAMFHVLINNAKCNGIIRQDSILAKFIIDTKQMSAEERGHFFQSHQKIKQEHGFASKEGQSQIKTEVKQHYIAIIFHQGSIYELDGCKKGPVKHRQCSQQFFLPTACSLVEDILARDPLNINCSVIALVKKCE